MAKAAGARHFSLVSAQGANPGVWACDLKPFHPLLYMRTKGKAEEAVKAQGFQYTTILRPGEAGAVIRTAGLVPCLGFPPSHEPVLRLAS